MQTIEPKPQPTNLIQKLAAVMAAVHSVPKNGRNEFHRYDYATEADINRAVRASMAAQGVMLIPSVERLDWREVETKNGKERIATLHVRYTVTDGVEERQFIVIGEGQDRGDKATYKAMTGASKYALLKLFQIPTGDDPEKDEEEGPKAAPRSNGNGAAKQPPKLDAKSRTVEERKRDLAAELTGLGFAPAGVKTWVKEVLGHDRADTTEDMDRLESALVIVRSQKTADAAADLNY